METDAALAERVLRQYGRVAVVGVSDDPRRPSFRVASYLRDAGYDVTPVNPRLTQWRGLPCHPSLREVPGPIEIVDIFRRSELVRPIVEDAIARGAAVVWMQDGVIDHAAADAARRAGMTVIMDRCMLRDHAALVHRGSGS